MQYKIPVQIENDDPIFLGLSLKQLIILMIWWAITYMIFNWLAPSVWAEIASIPAFLIAIITLIIVLFKHSEMTFIPFVLNFFRQKVNSDPKIWSKWIDSYEQIEIWFVTQDIQKKKKHIELESKKSKLEKIQDKLNKI